MLFAFVQDAEVWEWAHKDNCAMLRLFRAKLCFGLNAFATEFKYVNVRQTAPTQQEINIVLVG